MLLADRVVGNIFSRLQSDLLGPLLWDMRFNFMDLVPGIGEIKGLKLAVLPFDVDLALER